jgi:hypothetical protein
MITVAKKAKSMQRGAKKETRCMKGTVNIFILQERGKNIILQR